jgi:phage gpG-like protein
MARASFEIKGLEPLLKKLEFLPAFQSGIRKGTIYTKALIAKTPPVRREKQPAKTHKQFIFLAWAIPNKAIPYPYVRGKSWTSEKLAQSWTMEFRNQDREGVVGTNVSYAPFVQDKKKQSAYHKATGWVTVQDVVKNHGKDVAQFVEEEIIRQIRGTP